MPIRYLSDLGGTLTSFLRIAGLRLKNTANTSIDVRNNADTQFAALRAAETRLMRPAGTNAVALTISSEPGAPVTYSLPVTVGSTNQVLTTDGSTGQLSWSTVATASNQVLAQQETIVFGSTSPVSVFTPPANATIRSVFVDVDTAFNGTPTLSVGVAGDTAKYMGATENDLTVAGTYEVAPMIQEGASPAAVIITYAAGGASAGSCIVVVEYSNPG